MADFLRKIPKKNFELECFTNIFPEKLCPTQKELKKEINKLFDIASGKKLKCDSVACALGWTPTIFPKLCEWRIQENYFKDGYETVLTTKNGHEDYNLGREIFGLNEEEVQYLFSPDYYRYDHRGPVSVANRIEDFIKRGLPKQYKIY